MQNLHSLLLFSLYFFVIIIIKITIRIIIATTIISGKKMVENPLKLALFSLCPPSIVIAF